MSLVRSRRIEGALMALLVTMPLALMAFDWRYHEFWRDEAQAFTLARDVPLDSLYGALRRQGLPPLYYLLLRLCGAVLPSPGPLLVLGALGNGALLFGTYRLLFAVSGARRASLLLTLGFSFTYVYAYELGVIVRQYSLGLGLALACLAYLREALRTGAQRDVVLGTAAGAFSALTSAHAACVSGGALLVFGSIMLVRRGGPRVGWPVLLALPCFALVYFMASPYPGRIGGESAGASHDATYLLRLALHLVPASTMPVDWWHAESLPETLGWVCVARYAAFLSLAAAVCTALAARFWTIGRRPCLELYMVAAIVVSWVPLVAIIGNHYYGFFRHHLHMSLPVVVLVAGWGIDGAVDVTAALVIRRAALVLMAPWFLFGYFMSAENIRFDRRYPFSDTKEQARRLPPNAHVITTTGGTTVAMLAWRPDLVLRAADGHGRHYRFQDPDTAWHDNVPVGPLVTEECRDAPDRVYVTSPSLSSPACTSPVSSELSAPPDRPVMRETFGLWRVDCACLN